MQLDKTSIVIANRGLADTLDLSCIVMREHWRGILFYGLLGVIPFAILNGVLTWPLNSYEELSVASAESSGTMEYRLRYYAVMMYAVFLQAPLAFSLVTSYIGQTLFQPIESTSQVLSFVKPKVGRIVLVLGILRMGLLSFIPLYFLYSEPNYNSFLEIGSLLFLMVAGAFGFRTVRPFAPEVIILEGCQLRVPANIARQTISYGKRIGWLSRVSQGESITTQAILTFVTAVLAFLVCSGFVFATGVLFGVWEWGIWIDVLVYPCVLWTLGAWMTVIRFLCYTNVRIRTEGWELQLKLKAEGARLEELICE